jgi:hypothetical protein
MEKEESYILFIQWGKKLEGDFISFATQLKKFNINLIPVKPQELDYFIERRQIPVIVITSSLAEYQKFRSLRKQYFDFYVKTRKIKLFHLNSFMMDHELAASSLRKAYIHVPLPISFEKATLLVLSFYMNVVEGDNRWPGGKRSKLPTLGESEA